MENQENVIVNVYELRDPRDLECKPRYVGITTKTLEKRLSSHIISRNVTNSHKNNWLKSLLKDNVKPTIHLIEQVIGWEHACEIEKYWIREFKEQGYNLINSTDGGEGVLGFVQSKESILKMALAVSKANKGKTPSNIEYMREMQKRAIIEYENGIFIREYSSCKEAGDVLDVNYKLINNVLRRKVKYIKQYPNKTWIYKDGQEVHSMRKNNKSAWKKGLFKKVIQTSLDDKIIAIFLSIDDAAEKLNICRNTVINNCNNYTVKCIKLNCKFKYE